MSHTTIIISSSLLDIFDASNPEYDGARDHFTADQLARIDAIRAFPATHQYTIAERVFVSAVLAEAIFTADNP